MTLVRRFDQRDEWGNPIVADAEVSDVTTTAWTMEPAPADSSEHAPGTRAGFEALSDAAVLIQAMTKRPEFVRPAVRVDVAEAATYALALLGETTVGGLLARINDLPEVHHAAVARLRDLDLSLLAHKVTVASQLADLVAEVRYKETFVLRMLTTPQPTLEEVGVALGDVTRERIRQRVSGDLDRLKTLLSTPEFALLAEYIAQVWACFAEVRAVSDESANRLLGLSAFDEIGPEAGSRLVLELSGLTLHAGWVGRTRSAIEEHMRRLNAALSEVDIVQDGFVALAERHGVSTSDIKAAAASNGVGRWISDDCFVRWNGSAAAKAEIVLRLVLRPLTADELAEFCNDATSARNLVNQMAQDARFIRTDRQSRYALAEWGLEEYGGIAEEIVQRVERSGGVASRAAIVEEFTAQFGVSERSIDTYLRLQLFSVTGDEVRLGDPSRFDPLPPHSIPTAVRTLQGWGERLEITSEALRGYSFMLNPHIAWANGIRPQDDLVVPVAGSDRTASVIWRVTSVNGRVDVGHLSRLLKERDLAPSCPLVICPTRDRVYLYVGQDEIDETRRAAEQQGVLPDSTKRRLEALG